MQGVRAVLSFYYDLIRLITWIWEILMPLSRICMPKLLITCLFFVSFQLFWEGPCTGKDHDFTISIQMENDFFGGDTDRHYTHGTRVEFITQPIKWISDAADKMPWFSSEEAFSDPKDKLQARATISIGQSIYTPEDKTSTELVINERPYAGWLYIGFGIAANQGSRRYDKVQLEIGIIGPDSFAEDIQSQWHSVLGLYEPKGWENQLSNEPGIALYYEQARRQGKHRTFLDLEYDIIPHIGGCIGNVFTYCATGITARLGKNLYEDFGPPRIRPSLPGSSYFRTGTSLSYYVFAGVEGRAVLQNIFLDGNSFTDSHSVDKKIFVGDLQAGLVIQFDRFRVTYTQIYRTKEFRGQQKEDIFGSLSLSCQF